MKFLFIYDCLFPETVGGVEHRNFRLARALADLGHKVALAGWGDVDPPAHPNVTILRLPLRAKLHDADGKRGLLPTLRFALSVLTLDLRSYDVVETANIPYLHLFPLALTCRRARKPLIVTWHEYFGPLWKSYKSPLTAPFFALVESLAARLGSFAVAVSSLTAQRLAKARDAQTIPLLPNGVDLEDIASAAQNPATGVPPLLYAGRLIPEKRVDLLLRAVALLSPTNDAPLLGIIGLGPDNARLEALAHALNLQNKVRFYGRVPESADVLRLLAGTRIAVQPSAREGFGLFPLEAMALGLPVVYCESPDNAIADLVRDGTEGLMAAPNPESLAAKLAALLEDRALCAALGKKGRTRAALFDWRALAKEAEAFFTQAKATF